MYFKSNAEFVHKHVLALSFEVEYNRVFKVEIYLVRKDEFLLSVKVDTCFVLLKNQTAATSANIRIPMIGDSFILLASDFICLKMETIFSILTDSSILGENTNWS